eukprot:TRINITY_DN17839_c0_g1_i1.p1 TRINITY_DN17839_c0_g1~~TRINITY_DN17839_c0_g1_i1.p1  ORF type:complete len:487 (+),score=68.61 TRINITY_DN17839_c0_g1_i1:82-1542(+)
MATEPELPETRSGAICKAAAEVAPVFLLAGCGMVASGALLDSVSSTWTVFQDVPSLLILVPALLGLKGNLEMTLGARLGSHANKGDFKTDKFWPIVTSNLMAVTCQALIVGAAASALAIVENYAATGVWNTSHALLLASSATTAAALASLVLSSLMVAIVVFASNKGVDPDNISAPIAGMLGDFCTLGIVSLVAKYFWELPSAAFEMLSLLLIAYAALAVVCGIAASRKEYTVEIMKYGWYPVLMSMLLSNLSGPISERSIARYKTFARFQVVMNGAGGNLGSILSAKLSTDLGIEKSKLTSGPPKMPMVSPSMKSLTRTLTTMCMTKDDVVPGLLSQDEAHHNLMTSWVDMRTVTPRSHFRHFATVSILCGEGDMVSFARLLLFLIIPGQAIFASVVVAVASGWSALPTPMFLGCFILASLTQVMFLFLIARTFVVLCWRKEIDPDNAASPLVCGMGDLLGTSLMTLAFMAVQQMGGEAWPGAGL